jgi:hypothetical protein
MELNGTIYFRGCLCVPQKAEVKMNNILRDANSYSGHGISK